MKLNCILLVDDDEITNFLNKRILRNVDAATHIVAVESGEEALDYLRRTGIYKNSNVPKPDLILLDINMPGISGFEFMEEYKTLCSKKKCDMVVIMLTKSIFAHDEIRASAIDEIQSIKYKPLTEELARELVENYHRQLAM
ncbi:MAG: response regulator [Sphingobacteriales bacterium]|nr:MAG: response regulator [Sphingobacteriales bacterium]